MLQQNRFVVIEMETTASNLKFIHCLYHNFIISKRKTN